jgi:Ca2+-transporting ATPase
MTWAAVELGMFQRLLDTTSLSRGEWEVVLALSLLAPTVGAADKLIRIRRQRSAVPEMELREPDAATSAGIAPPV